MPTPVENMNGKHVRLYYRDNQNQQQSQEGDIACDSGPSLQNPQSQGHVDITYVDKDGWLTQKSIPREHVDGADVFGPWTILT